MPDKPSRQAPAVDPLEQSRRRLSYLDEKLRDPSLPPELRKKMQAARNLQERAVRLREKACSDQRKAPPERGQCLTGPWVTRRS